MFNKTVVGGHMRYFTDFNGDIRLLCINFCYTNHIVFQFILKFPILPLKVTDPNVKKLKKKLES